VTRARYRPASSRVEALEVWVSATADFQVGTGRQEDNERWAFLLRGDPAGRAVRGWVRRRVGVCWPLIESRVRQEPRARHSDGRPWRDDPRILPQHPSRWYRRSAARGLNRDHGVSSSRHATAASHADPVAARLTGERRAPVLASDSCCTTTGHGRWPTCSIFADSALLTLIGLMIGHAAQVPVLA
jgi:hypothetical protein